MTEGTVDMALEDSPKLATHQLEGLLREKYPRDRYALFLDVPDAVSLDARRRIDAVAVGIWKSVGRSIDAFELKVSRTDWLRELKQVDKADPFISICDRFWLVTGDPSIAKLDEIPACWGWMTATKHGLRVQRPAEKLPQDRTNLPWGFTLGLLRKLQDDLVSGPDVRALITESRGELERQHARNLEQAGNRASRELKDLREKVEKFEQESGIALNDWHFGNAGNVVKSLLELGYEGNGTKHVSRVLTRQAEELQRLLKTLGEVAAEIEAPAPTKVTA